MAPAGDPYEAIVSFALPSNVDTVIVDGRILRRAGRFTAYDHPQIVAAARDAAYALRDKAKWPAG
jgi:5-methylthioadenosine/S-adenosylhomocysteine deaminase